MPTVSVIVPVYQVENYLPACLDSILAQTYRDFELILVNDGTRDGCVRIMEEYARRDQRIVMIHKENGGLSSARNAGLDCAQGRYILFVDSDDTIVPELLNDAVHAMEETHADQVLWDYSLVDEDGIHEPYLGICKEIINLNELGLANYFYRYWMPYRHGQEAWSKLYRREIIEKNGLRFAPNDAIFAEDTLFSAMYLMHTNCIAALGKAYVHYLQRKDSLMGKHKPKLARRLMELSVRLCAYAESVGREPEIRQVLPVLCYDKLICKGIRLDPSEKDVYEAMRLYRQNPVMRNILKRLLGARCLLAYTLHTGKGIRTQIRARLFAWYWLNGFEEKAAAFVEGRVTKQ